MASNASWQTSVLLLLLGFFAPHISLISLFAADARIYTEVDQLPSASQLQFDFIIIGGESAHVPPAESNHIIHHRFDSIPQVELLDLCSPAD